MHLIRSAVRLVLDLLNSKKDFTERPAPKSVECMVIVKARSTFITPLILFAFFFLSHYLSHILFDYPVCGDGMP